MIAIVNAIAMPMKAPTGAMKSALSSIQSISAVNGFMLVSNQ
jgi:hypothetical protein